MQQSDPSPFAVGSRAGLEMALEFEAPSTAAAPLLKTEIMPLDHALGGGLRAGEVTVVGAPTGHGKSALAEQIALAVSCRYRTTYFALELGRRRTEHRLLSKILHTDLRSVTNLWENRHGNLRVALDMLTYDHALIVEERDVDVAFTANDLFAMAIANAPKLIVIDHPRHLDDWNGGAKGRSDLAAAEITRRFVSCARYLGAHIIIVAQTKSALLGKRPLAQDIADTYVLAQAADAVIMLHRPFRGQGMKDRIAELIVDKNRNGPEGIVHTRWHGPTMSYTDLTPDEENDLECCKPRVSSDERVRSVREPYKS